MIILKKDKELNLKTVQNSIKDAKISKKEAIKEYQKLTIKSPIDWIIQKIFINKWQEINTWIQLFWIINDNIPQVKIEFSKNEMRFLKENMLVKAEINGELYNAKLISFSKIANSNFNYTWIIKLEENNNSFGEVLKIKIPLTSKWKLIPLNLVRLSNKESIGKIKTLNNKQVKFEEIKFWKVFWNKIEILECLNKNIDCNNLNIILE